MRRPAPPTLVEPAADALARAGELTEAGIDLQKRGDRDGAATRYRDALKLVPNHAAALHFLGVVHHQNGAHVEARRLIEQSIAQEPANAKFHSNLGAVLAALDDTKAAAESLRKAADLDPENLVFTNNLAAALEKLEDWKGTIECYERAVAIAPKSVEFGQRLGDLCNKVEDFERAISAFEDCLKLAPEDALLHSSLAFACEKSGRLEEAERHYRRAAECAPEMPELSYNLGQVLKQLGRTDEAETYLRVADAADPSAWRNPLDLARIRMNEGAFREALDIYGKAVNGKPDDVIALRDYGMALIIVGRPLDAIKVLDRAIALDPGYALAYSNRSLAYSSLNYRARAVEDLEKALSIEPDLQPALFGMSPNLLAMERYEEAHEYSRALVTAERRKPELFANPHKTFRTLVDFDSIAEIGDIWKHAADTKAQIKLTIFLEMLALTETGSDVKRMAGFHSEAGEWLSAAANRAPLPPLPVKRKGGKIRLGLLSSDLRTHSVAKFLMPLVRQIDRERFEIFCYSPMDAPDDPMQALFKREVDAFRILTNWSDRDAATMIREDQVDILFDLNGHTQRSQVSALAYKPAPVQIEWLGYPFTTGMKEIDYLLLDPRCRPEDDSLLTETVLEMPESWICFGEYSDDAIRGELPHERNDGIITFGTQNSPYKYTPRIFDLWAQTMHAVPDSRFLIVRGECKSTILVSNVCKEFARRGIDRERLVFVNNHISPGDTRDKEPPRSHMDYYNEMDISLDTFPVTGGTTTCDALWMGVPVVSLYGPSIHHRLGYSILTSAGLGDLCTVSDDDYVAIAAGLATDTERLRDIRLNQRDRLRASPLCNAPRFAGHFQNLMLDLVERHNLR